MVPPLPRPPLSRDWYGSMIAPYGANIQFVLHRRTDAQVIMLENLVAYSCHGRGAHADMAVDVVHPHCLYTYRQLLGRTP